MIPPQFKENHRTGSEDFSLLYSASDSGVVA